MMKEKNNRTTALVCELSLVTFLLAATGAVLYILLFFSKSSLFFMGYYLLFALLLFAALFKMQIIYRFMQRCLRTGNVDENPAVPHDNDVAVVLRHFSTEYKQAFLDEYDTSTVEQRKALLKMENIPSGYISRWRRQLAKKEEEANGISQENAHQIVALSQIMLSEGREPHERKSEDLNVNKVQIEKRVCPACETVVSTDDDACTNCGTFLGAVGI